MASRIAGEVDDGGDAGEVLHEHALGVERELLLVEPRPRAPVVSAHRASASTCGAVTLTPSSWRSTFSSSTLIENGQPRDAERLEPRGVEGEDRELAGADAKRRPRAEGVGVRGSHGAILPRSPRCAARSAGSIARRGRDADLRVPLQDAATSASSCVGRCATPTRRRPARSGHADVVRLLPVFADDRPPRPRRPALRRRSGLLRRRVRLGVSSRRERRHVPDLAAALRERLQPAFDALEPGADPVVRQSDRGDYQANGVMALAKRLGRPAARARRAGARPARTSRASPRSRSPGPGFLNLTLDDAYLAALVAALARRRPASASPASDPRHRVALDYSHAERRQGDARRPPAQHGDRRRPRAAPALLRPRGRRPEPRGGLGDAVRDADRAPLRRGRGRGRRGALRRRPRRVLQGGPREVRADRGVRGPKPPARRRPAGRRRRDAPALAHPRRRVDATTSTASTGGSTSTLRPEDVVGESCVQPDARPGRRRPRRRRVSSSRATAPCACSRRASRIARATPLPLIVRKRDGGYGYAATDLAAIRDRVGQLGCDRLDYVVGAPQAQHLEMVFAVAQGRGLGARRRRARRTWPSAACSARTTRC